MYKPNQHQCQVPLFSLTLNSPSLFKSLRLKSLKFLLKFYVYSYYLYPTSEVRPKGGGSLQIFHSETSFWWIFFPPPPSFTGSSRNSPKDPNIRIHRKRILRMCTKYYIQTVKSQSISGGFLTIFTVSPPSRGNFQVKLISLKLTLRSKWQDLSLRRTGGDGNSLYGNQEGGYYGAETQTSVDVSRQKLSIFVLSQIREGITTGGNGRVFRVYSRTWCGVLWER